MIEWFLKKTKKRNELVKVHSKERVKENKEEKSQNSKNKNDIFLEPRIRWYRNINGWIFGEVMRMKIEGFSTLFARLIQEFNIDPWSDRWICEL